MRYAALLVLSAAVAHASTWATVPASRDVSQIEAFTVPNETDVGVVCLVGSASRDSPIVPRPVEAISLDRGAVTRTNVVQLGKTPERPPPEAIWPGPDGKSAAPKDISEASDADLPNPWKIRIHPQSEILESVFLNGGVIGEGADAVALMNGRIASRGSIIDGFNVSSVASSFVVVEKDGVLYVIPKGRRVVIQVARG